MALIPDPMNLGPLTTVFTAPLACSTDALYVNNNRDCAGSVSVLRGPVATSSGGRCFPPGFDGRAGVYYSPGLCPRGYTVACTSVVGGRPLAGNTAASDLAETVLTCCPQAAQGLTYGCSAGPEWTWGGCHATLGGATVTLTGATRVECGTTREAGPGFVWDGVAQAQSVQVRFRAGDESLFETGRDTAPATATATAPSSPNSATPVAGGTEPAPRASDNAQESGVGAGSPSTAHPALAAVAASCSAIVVVAIAVAAFLFVRTRRVARELRDREKELSDRFYHGGKPSPGDGGDGDAGDENPATVVTVTALGATPPTTSPAPVVAAPAPPDVSPLSVANARLAVGPAPAELGTAPQYEMEGSPVVRQQRGRQAPFPAPAPPPPPLPVQTESPTVGKAVTTQEMSPVSEAESSA